MTMSRLARLVTIQFLLTSCLVCGQTYQTSYAADATTLAEYDNIPEKDDTSFVSSSSSSYILNGIPAGNDEFQWFGRTAITIFKRFPPERYSGSCGASLIHSDIAISAAHCIVDAIQAGFKFTIDFNLGANQFDGSDGTVLEVESAIYPPTYGPLTDDVVFYKLRTSVTSVTPVQWNTDPLIPAVDDIGTAIGFGWIDNEGNASPILLKANLTSISDEECEEYHFVAPSVTCTYNDGMGGDVCYGDSGGPLLSQSGVIIGMTSFGGSICGSEPAGFTQTSYFTDFITMVICENSDNPPASCPPVVDPECGLFGLSLFCPLTFGGLLGRLFGSIFGNN